MLSPSVPPGRVGIGKFSRRFLPADSAKPCVIGGLIFEDIPGFSGASDGDVIFHAICNAITSITGIAILGGVAHELCHKDGITDSQVYLEKALETMIGQKVVHVALSLEGARPRLQGRIDAMREKIAQVMRILPSQVGITATSGDGLTDVGCGDGVQCSCILTTRDQ